MERVRELSNQGSASIKGRQILLSSSLDSSREVVHKLLGMSSMGPQTDPWTHLRMVGSLGVPMDSACEPLQTVGMHEQRACWTLQGWEKTHKLEDHRALPLGNKTEPFNTCLALWD